MCVCVRQRGWGGSSQERVIAVAEKVEGRVNVSMCEREPAPTRGNSSTWHSCRMFSPLYVGSSLRYAVITKQGGSRKTKLEARGNLLSTYVEGHKLTSGTRVRTSWRDRRSFGLARGQRLFRTLPRGQRAVEKHRATRTAGTLDRTPFQTSGPCWRLQARSVTCD